MVKQKKNKKKHKHSPTIQKNMNVDQETKHALMCPNKFSLIT
jgi:hypothetical protein